MKYAILQPCDQTITYLTFANNIDEPEFGETTKHDEAGLWDNKEDAQKIATAYNNFAFDGEEYSVVEEVLDVEEFRNRKDTW